MPWATSGIARYDGFSIDQYANVVAAARSKFANDIFQIVGYANARLMIAPARADTTTTTDLSVNAYTCTWDADIAARLSQLGLGYAQTFASASSQYGTVPDAANLSFGDGTTDSPFSIVVLANVTNTAAGRPLLTKFRSDSTDSEYQLVIGATDLLEFYMRDASVPTVCYRVSDAAITMGSQRLYSVTYDGGGGATAANGIILQQDASTIASTATNSGTYVAMENLGLAVAVGAYANGTAFIDGSVQMSLLVAGVLSSTQLTDIKTAVNLFYGTSL